MSDLSPLKTSREAAQEEIDIPTPRRQGALTTYLRALGENTQLEEASFGDFWTELTAWVSWEVHRRGLGRSPPRYVGVDTHDRWTRNAFEELTTDCYAFILQRLRALKVQLKVKDNIDGLVILNVRHFLHERQKRADPFGFRIYEVVRGATRSAVEAGTLVVVSGNEEIDNGTHLAPSPAAGPIDDETLEVKARAWLDDLLPDLVLARGRRRKEAEQELGRRLAEISLPSGTSFPFKALLDACKGAARVRWQATWRQELGDLAHEGDLENDGEGATVPIALQDLRAEDDDQFFALINAIDAALQAVEMEQGERQYLLRLWDFLRTGAADPDTSELPSRRRVAELLGIPRYLLPRLYRHLGSVVAECREHLGRMP